MSYRLIQRTIEIYFHPIIISHLEGVDDETLRVGGTNIINIKK